MPGMRRYKAFISYSHGDEAWARWLQRALETWRLPKKLRERHPDLPARLFPIFRDREELASATNLTDSIQQAIGDSEALIVICSPQAAASRWVNEEIRHFQSLGEPDRVFCLLVSGSPTPGAADCAFPSAVLLDAQGQRLHEPLAADVRPGGDGKRNAMLKIAAGLLGVGVDELRRRDAQRQARLWSAVAAGSLLVALVTIGLAITAVIAKRESEVRRHQAENLIGFMLGDLRAKLEPIGKLELLDSIGDQSMVYFEAMGNQGTPQEMLDRAKALRQIGDVRFNQGRLEPALHAFQQSLAQAQVLHTAAPNNNDYLFELGQAEFWVGYVAWQRNELDQALASMQRYMDYSRQLSTRDPGNAAYRMELAFAHSNLGSVARAKGLTAQALSEFRQAAQIGERELSSKPDDGAARSDLAEIWSWVGSTLLDLGRLEESEQASTRAAELLRPLHESGADPRMSARYGDFLILLADVQIRRGKTEAASALITRSRDIFKRMIEHDPGNAGWRRSSLVADYFRQSLLTPAQWSPAERRALDTSIRSVEVLLEKDQTNPTLWYTVAKMERMRAQAALWQGDAATAQKAAYSARALVAKASPGGQPTPSDRLSAIQIEQTLGECLLANGDSAGAEVVWRAALASLGPETGDGLATLAMRRQLLLNLGLHDGDERIAARLAQAGFADPRFNPIPVNAAPVHSDPSGSPQVRKGATP